MSDTKKEGAATDVATNEETWKIIYPEVGRRLQINFDSVTGNVLLYTSSCGEDDDAGKPWTWRKLIHLAVDSSGIVMAAKHYSECDCLVTVGSLVYAKDDMLSYAATHQEDDAFTWSCKLHGQEANDANDDLREERMAFAEAFAEYLSKKA